MNPVDQYQMKVQDTFMSMIFEMTNQYHTETINTIVMSAPVIIDEKCG